MMGLELKQNAPWKLLRLHATACQPRRSIAEAKKQQLQHAQLPSSVP
jgi:hypothetical protein